MSKKTQSKKQQVETAIKAALAASKETPTLTDAQKLRLFEATREFDAANYGASVEGVGEALKALMHERIKRLEAAKATFEALGKQLCPSGWTLDLRTGTFTKKPHSQETP